MLTLALTFMLSACGDNTATPGSMASSTATAVPTGATTTSASTTAVTTSDISSAGGGPATTTNSTDSATKPTPAQKAGKPVISFSTTTLRLGDTLKVSGSGFPANTPLTVQINGVNTKVTPATDADGKFAIDLMLDTSTNLGGTPLKAGKVTVGVTDASGSAKASASLTLTAPLSNANEVINGFFNTLKIDPEGALSYLGTTFRASFADDPVALAQKLGVQNIPSTVEIGKAAGMNYTYKVTMHFASSNQVVYMDVLPDLDGGSLKITDIRQTPDTGERSSAAENDRQAHATIEQYVNGLNNKQYRSAYEAFSNSYRQQIGSYEDFAKNQDSISSIKLVAADQENVAGTGESKLIYKVLLNVQAGNKPSNWSAGNNTRWFEVTRENNAWKISQITTSPIA
ncbi:MAG TPA: hypothetical protein VH186_39135 [Chloroflexia bacterium]|nr:hypothetical protein [Chloroflexia bacterium]